MNPAEPGHVWLFHAGALGDSVLLWPLLRTLLWQGRTVTLTESPSKGAVARAWLCEQTGRPAESLRTVDADSAFARGLWAGRATERHHAVGTVLCFLLGEPPTAPAEHPWLAAAREAFPRADVRLIGPVGSASRRELLQRLAVSHTGRAPLRSNPSGPIAVHVGAGSRSKRWPMDRWATLVAALREAGHAVAVFMGEVEMEQFTDAERAFWREMLRTDHGGGAMDDLPALAHALAPCRLFIGADTGPTHLAAELGLPTLALFGPTDPAMWAPLGAPGAVAVLAPPSPMEMEWLPPERVLDAADHWLRPSPPSGGECGTL
ncbi:MAG: glycosyltransferase family 9 protein [Planctomycetaceae bacterium]|jgi:heptosyltransferase-3|nr:glycosyltransferase family 9 protein [Phycisphaerales bacterium]MCE2652892.1 glycosyltransferase family 9 protein [Planctomycetaceae bacterium]